MGQSGDVRYVIVVDSTGATKSIQDFDKAIEGLKQTTVKGQAAHESFGGQLTKNLIPAFTAASLAADGIRKVLSASRQFVSDAIRGAIEEEQSERRLATALDMTGRFRRAALASFLSFAKGQSQATLYTHEEIAASMTLLATLTDLDEQGIQEVTKGIMGLAATIGPEGGGLENVTKMVTKAVKGHMEGLARYGLIVQDTGSKEGNLLAIRQRLLELYPRATAEIATMGGELKQTAKAWAEFKEGFGQALLDALQARDLMPIAAKAIKSITDETKNGASELGRYNMQMAAVRGWLSPYTIQANEAARKTSDLDSKIKEMADDFFSDLRPKAEAVTVSVKAVGKSLAELQKNVDSAKGFDYKYVDTSDPWGLNQFNEDIAEAEPRWGEFESELATSIVNSEKLANDLLEKITGIANSSPIKVDVKVATKVSGLDNFLKSMSLVSSQLSDIASAITTGEEIRVENWYKKRLNYINKTISSETKKEKAIAALEAEYEIKKTSAKRKAAIEQKAVSIMEATVNTANAVTKALAQGGFLSGPIWAAFVGAMGAVQIGLIAAQPIPLAKGALFNQRTVLASGFETAEAGYREITSPEPLMRQIVKEETRTTREENHIHINLGGIQAWDGADVQRVVKNDVIPMIQQAINRKIIRVH